MNLTIKLLSSSLVVLMPRFKLETVFTANFCVQQTLMRRRLELENKIMFENLNTTNYH